MRKLTPEEIKEPDITLTIPASIWASLPQEVKDTLSHWIDRGNGSNHVFVLPAYRARELEAITRGWKNQTE